MTDLYLAQYALIACAVVVELAAVWIAYLAVVDIVALDRKGEPSEADLLSDFDND